MLLVTATKEMRSDMKTNLEEISNLERRVSVEVPIETIAQTYARVYKKIQKGANIKGFRKGKAPITLIRNMYKDSVQEDVVRDLIQEGFFTAIQNHNLDPIGQPEFEFDKLNEDKSFSFTAEFEIRPTVKVDNYEGLEIEREKLTVTDEEVDQRVQGFRQRFKEAKAIFEDRAAATGDIAVISFDGYLDGAPLEQGQADNFELELGSNSFIEGFEEGVTGMKIGESRTLNLQFPEVYHDPNIAGKPVEFKVVLKGLKKSELPELNDELVQRINPGIKTVEEFRKTIREFISNQKKEEIDSSTKDKVIKKLVELNPVEVPRSLLKSQKESLVEDFMQRMKSQGMPVDQLDEYTQKWDADFSASASQMIQSSFLISELAQRLNLNPTEKQVDEQLLKFSQGAGLTVEKAKEYKDRIRFQMIEDAVINFLLDKAKIKEVEPSVSPSTV